MLGSFEKSDDFKLVNHLLIIAKQTIFYSKQKNLTPNFMNVEFYAISVDTNVFKGERFANESILDIRTHFKPTETFQYTHFSNCHPPGVNKRASLKAKQSDFSEQTTQIQNLKLKSHNSKHILWKEDTQKLCFRQSSQR